MSLPIFCNTTDRADTKQDDSELVDVWFRRFGQALILVNFTRSPPVFFGLSSQSSSFGRPLTTAGRLFTAGGPRSFQFVVKFSF